MPSSIRLLRCHTILVFFLSSWHLGLSFVLFFLAQHVGVPGLSLGASTLFYLPCFLDDLIQSLGFEKTAFVSWWLLNFYIHPWYLPWAPDSCIHLPAKDLHLDVKRECQLDSPKELLILSSGLHFPPTPTFPPSKYSTTMCLDTQAESSHHRVPPLITWHAALLAPPSSFSTSQPPPQVLTWATMIAPDEASLLPLMPLWEYTHSLLSRKRFTWSIFHHMIPFSKLTSGFSAQSN